MTPHHELLPNGNYFILSKITYEKDLKSNKMIKVHHGIECTPVQYQLYKLFN